MKRITFKFELFCFPQLDIDIKVNDHDFPDRLVIEQGLKIKCSENEMRHLQSFCAVTKLKASSLFGYQPHILDST